MLVLAAGLVSCMKDSCPLTDGPNRSVMSVTIEDESGKSDDYREAINTVRVIVFDNASTAPRLDVNKMVTISGNETGTKFTVKMETSQNSDKLVIAIVNEPAGASHALSVMDHPDGLEDLMFLFADILNANHTTVKTTGMPMAGVVRGVSVNAAHTQSNPKMVDMTIERAVARVDVYLRKDASMASRGIEITPSTVITLKNTFAEGYLVAGTKADGTREQSSEALNFGHLMTVAPSDLRTVKWSPTATMTVPPVNSQLLVCSFYTPERTCNAVGDADKLKLVFENIRLVGLGNRNGEITIRRMSNPSAGVTDSELQVIRRNNVYEVIATVKSIGLEFQAQVVPWRMIDMGVEIPTTYYLDTSVYELRIHRAMGVAKMIVRTDYPRGWRAECFEDPDCTIPMTNNFMSLSVTSVPSAAPLGTEVIVTLGADVQWWRYRYIRFTAGRKSLVVSVWTEMDVS